MKIPKTVVAFVSVIILLLILGAVTGIFFSRAPVLVVTDNSFNLLYGSWRTRFKQAENSLRLFRPVRMVIVSEDAGPDLVAVSVKSAFEKPYAVFFPYRYEAGALYYMEENPAVPLAVFGGRSRSQRNEESLLFIPTDTALDYYRAARAALLLSGENQGDILFFNDGTMTSEDRRAFSAGLEAGGDSRNPVYLSIQSDYSGWQNAACVLVNGSASHYFEKNITLPAILFSWVDPAMTPRSVKLILDDSPWAHVLTAVKEIEAGKPGEGFSLPSELVVLKDRFEDRVMAERIAGLSFEKPAEEAVPEEP